MQEIFIDSISDQIGENLEKLKKAKSVDDKVKYSEVIRNLSQALEHFSNTLSNLAAIEQDLSDFDDEYFDDEDEEENPFN